MGLRQESSRNTSNEGFDVWQSVLDALRNESEATYRSWFSHLKYQDFDKSVITVTAPSNFIKEWILNNYYDRIMHYCNTLGAGALRLDIRVRSNRASRNASEELSHFEEVHNVEKIEPNLNENSKYPIASALDPSLAFDNFVVGSSNKMAYEAVNAVAQGRKLPSASNLVYIYSAVGMGKTHLLQSIASYIGENDKGREVAYLSSEKFMNLYIKSVKNNDLITFKEVLRSVDVLLVDDLQFICGKVGTQQEFAHTFNALIEANKQVVISCDTSPYQLDIDPRSKSRLSGGLVVDIKHADYDLRLEILRYKAKLYNIEIEDSLLEFIAQKITSNIRELEGALHKICMHVNLMGTQIDMNVIQDILKDNLDAHSKVLTIDQIISTVADFYQVQSSDIISKSRAAKFVQPRQVIAFLAKQLTQRSLQEIGEKLGGRDHATVIYSIKKLEDTVVRNKKVERDIAKIMDLLGHAG